MSGSTDERREREDRYMSAVKGWASDYAWEITEAAMAVADAEIATLLAQLASDQLRGDVAYDRAVAAERENARLRAELVESRRRAMDSGKEVTRLREELRAALVLDGRAENTKEG